MEAPNCPKCGKPVTRAVDVPYAATRVDVAPWVHLDCMGELRSFHPQNPVTPDTVLA